MKAEPTHRKPKGQTRFGWTGPVADKRMSIPFIAEDQLRYRRILEAMDEAYFETNSEGKLTFFTDSFCRLTGRSRNEIEHLTLFAFPSQDDTQRLTTAFGEVLKTQTPISAIECTIGERNGRQTVAKISLRPMCDSRGRPAGVCGTALDVTEQKVLKSALAESESRYLNILESAPCAITINRASDGRYVQVNKVFCEYTGYSAEEVIGRNCLEIGLYLDESDERLVVDRIRRDKKIDYLEMAFHVKDGGIIETAFSARTIRMKGETCILSIATNITPIKTVERALKESEARYRAILETAPDPICLTRLRDGKYVEVNSAFYHRTGYTPEEIIGRTATDIDLYVNPSDRCRLVAELEAHGSVNGIEMAVRLKDGTISRDLWSGRTLQYEGEPHLVVVSRDIRELQAIQHALKESEESHRTILNTAPFSIAIVRWSDHTFIQVNDSFCRNTGFSREEAIGRTIRELNMVPDPDDEKRFLELYSSKGFVDDLEVQARRKDGRIAVTLISARPIRYTGEKCLLLMTADITTLKATQRALEEREARYRTILDTAPYSIVITRRWEATYLEVNDAFCGQTGYSRQEAIGHTPFELNLYVNPADRNQITEIIRQKGQVDGLEVRFRKKDGSILDSLISSSPIQYGGEECLLTIVMDISVLKEYQNALKESEAGYRTILESAPYSIIVTRLSDSCFMQVNEVFCRRTGFSREDTIGNTFHDLNIFVDPAVQKRMLEIFLRDGRVEGMGVQFRAKDGSILDSLISVTPITYKGDKCLLAVTVDIDELKEAQDALRESERKYRNILANIEEGYWEVDLRGSFTFVNESEARIHRTSPQELIGKNNRSFSRPETAKEIYRIFNQVYRTGIPAKVFDYELLREDGATAFIEMSASLLKDASGRPIGFFGISRDMTEKRSAEKELEKYRHQLEEMVAERTRALEAAQKELLKREKLAVLGQLTATVSHELRNPLGVIRSSNFYLQRKIRRKDEKIDKHFRRIEEQVAACDTIVADLLEYTRGRNVSVAVANINPWIDALLSQQNESESIPIESHLAPDLPAVAHDQEKMRRVLINLLNNALLAVRDKQGMLKESSHTFRPLVRVATRQENQHVIIEVEDNGIGMTEETRQRALEPLFTTRARGTGIGLANVNKIVNEHNGSISLISEPGTGTTVTVRLPCPPRKESFDAGNHSSGR